MEYDPRYLAGVWFFNQQDYFEAHDVWEDLWADTGPPERRFYQGLIQAAVGLLHFGNGNLGGAVKLYGSSRAYMEPYLPTYLGLDVTEFWRQMARCFTPLLGTSPPDRALRPDDALLPTIVLDPPPAHWPDPAEFVSGDD